MAQQVVVRVDPQNFATGLKNVKAMTGATYHAAAKAWTIDVGQVTRENAHTFGLIYGKYGNADKSSAAATSNDSNRAGRDKNGVSDYAATHYVGQDSMDHEDSIF